LLRLVLVCEMVPHASGREG